MNPEYEYELPSNLSLAMNPGSKARSGTYPSPAVDYSSCSGDPRLPPKMFLNSDVAFVMEPVQDCDPVHRSGSDGSSSHPKRSGNTAAVCLASSHAYCLLQTVSVVESDVHALPVTSEFCLLVILYPW